VTGWDVAWPALIFLTKAISFLMKEFENMSDRVSGTVSWFNNRRGYGAITPGEGPDVIFFSSAMRGEVPQKLKAGQRVEFSVEAGGPTGRQAQDVCLIQRARVKSC
jgi:CspA family cold shock protein